MVHSARLRLRRETNVSRALMPAYMPDVIIRIGQVCEGCFNATAASELHAPHEIAPRGPPRSAKGLGKRDIA